MNSFMNLVLHSPTEKKNSPSIIIVSNVRTLQMHLRRIYVYLRSSRTCLTFGEPKIFNLISSTGTITEPVNIFHKGQDRN